MKTTKTRTQVQSKRKAQRPNTEPHESNNNATPNPPRAPVAHESQTKRPNTEPHENKHADPNTKQTRTKRQNTEPHQYFMKVMCRLDIIVSFIFARSHRNGIEHPRTGRADPNNRTTQIINRLVEFPARAT